MAFDRIMTPLGIVFQNYPERFALCGLPVVKVGINFDSESHTLGDWIIEEQTI